MTMPMDQTRTAILTKPDGSKAKIPVRLLRISDVVNDTNYQRDPDSTWLQKRVREGWNEAQAGVITVSSRGGRLWCVDGQHRVALAQECGVSHVWAYVLEGLTQAQEADLFTKFQKLRRSLKVWDLFKADTVAQKDEAMTVARVVHRTGFRISRETGPGYINAVGTLLRIYRWGGEETLADTLTVIKRLWTLDDSMALRGQIIEGIALFLGSFQHQPQYSGDRLDKVLTTNAPARLMRDAQAIASKRSTATVGASNVGEALLDLYNRGISADRRLGPLTKSGKRIGVKRAVAS
jgi:hypothetical protein